MHRCRYEEAFAKVLDMSDVDRVTWVCQQLDPAQLLAQEPLPLSQSVLLSLMQQLGSQLGKVGYSDRFTARSRESYRRIQHQADCAKAA